MSCVMMKIRTVVKGFRRATYKTLCVSTWRASRAFAHLA